MKSFVLKFWFRFFIIISLILYLLTGLNDLYIDTLNPDGLNWHDRSFKFTEALLNKDFSNTFQAYHPGITLMWLTGPVLHFVSNNLVSQGFKSYSKDTFLIYDYWAKVDLVIFTSILFIYSLFLLKQIFTKKQLIIFSILMILEPFVLGVRRLFHLDYLATYLIFVSFLNFYIYFYKTSEIKYKILGVLFFVLAFLTKSSSLLFIPIPFFMLFFSTETTKKKIISALIIVFSSILFLFLLFPALWGNPLKTFPVIYQKIVVGIIDIGIENKNEATSSSTSDVMIYQTSKGDTNWYFYIQEIPYVLSPITLYLFVITIVFSFLKIWRKNYNSFTVFSILTFLLFIIGMSIATKKGLRYGMIFMPFLFLIISQFMENFRSKIFVFILGIYLVSLIPQYLLIHPYYYVYGNTLLGGVRSRTEIFDPSPFGVASYEVGNVLKPYMPEHTNVKIAASKIFKYVFPYSKIVNWPDCSADFAIVFALESLPEKVCGMNYIYLGKITIDNLDYWTIYKKN